MTSLTRFGSDKDKKRNNIDEHIGIVTNIREIFDTYPSTKRCWIQLKNINSAKKDTFVLIRDASRPNLSFIGRVIELKNISEILVDIFRTKLLKSKLNPEEYIVGSLTKPEYYKIYALVDLLFELDGDDVHTVDTPPTDASKVYNCDSKIIPQVLGFSLDKNKSICIGRLSRHENVEVCIDLNGFFRDFPHLVILGQSGAGKSYAVGVILEEAVWKGVPAIVFDHTGEYISMKETVEGNKGLNVLELDSESLSINFEELISDEGNLKILQSTFDLTDPQVRLIRLIYHHLKNRNQSITLEAFENNIDNVARIYGFPDITVDNFRGKFKILKDSILLDKGKMFDIQEIVKPGQLTVIDLSKKDDLLRNTMIIALILKKLRDARREKKIPPSIVVIEEAHNYASSVETPSSIMIKKFIREARHYGIGMILVSQRPVGLHKDVVNISNNYLLFRLVGDDLDYVRKQINLDEKVIEDLKSLDVGEAYLSSPLIRNHIPIKVVIRKRKTKHGGRGIDFI